MPAGALLPALLLALRAPKTVAPLRQAPPVLLTAARCLNSIVRKRTRLSETRQYRKVTRYRVRDLLSSNKMMHP